MIYNFTQLLKDQFPSETIYTNGRLSIGGAEIPDRNLLVNESGGVERPWIRTKTATVQIIARDRDTVACRDLAYDVFNFLTSRFGLLLPSVIVGGLTYPEFKSAQITAIQLPYNLGSDEEGRIEYSTNYEIIV